MVANWLLEISSWTRKDSANPQWLSTADATNPCLIPPPKGCFLPWRRPAPTSSHLRRPTVASPQITMLSSVRPRSGDGETMAWCRCGNRGNLHLRGWQETCVKKGNGSVLTGRASDRARPAATDLLRNTAAEYGTDSPTDSEALEKPAVPHGGRGPLSRWSWAWALAGFLSVRFM